MKTGDQSQQQPSAQKMGMQIERRVFLRLSGQEAEDLIELIKVLDKCGVKMYESIEEKLELALGRSNRLAKVLEENPPNHMKPHPANCECNDCWRERAEGEPL